MNQVNSVTDERGQNPVFPGFYREKGCPSNVGYVTKVAVGVVCWKATKGTACSALMGSMEFLTQYERV